MSEDQDAQSPWTRPGFIGAAGVVVIVAVLGIVLAVTTLLGTDEGQAAPAPTPGPSASETVATTAPATTPETEDDSSVCGLDGVELTGTLPAAPEAVWQYQGTTAYPTSTTYGPGATTPTGVRSCFQRSPAGALFMAANAFTQGSDPATAADWSEYAVGDGSGREQLISQVSAPGTGSSRIDLVGFRLLAFDGNTARIDLAARTSVDGTTANVSGVYELIWQEGDWKINSDVAEPLNVAVIPDTAGYAEFTP